MAAIAKPLSEREIRLAARARLAGQQPAFTAESLQPSRTQSSFAKPNAHVMKAAVQEWRDEDIRAVLRGSSRTGSNESPPRCARARTTWRP